MVSDIKQSYVFVWSVTGRAGHGAGWVNNWHISMLAVVSYLVVSVLLYSVSIALSSTSPDYRELEG